MQSNGGLPGGAQEYHLTHLGEAPRPQGGASRDAVANRMRAKEISFFIVSLAPAYKAGLAVHLSVNR